MPRQHPTPNVIVDIRFVPRDQWSPEQLRAWDWLWERLLAPSPEDLLKSARVPMLAVLQTRLEHLERLAADRERYKQLISVLARMCMVMLRDRELSMAHVDLIGLLQRRLAYLEDRERFLRWMWGGEPPADACRPLPPRRKRRRLG